MSALEVLLVSEGNCLNCNAIRAVLARLRHEYRHVEVSEVHPEESLGQSLAAEHGIPVLPALIIGGRLRLVGEMTEKAVRRELERAKSGR
jgi:hypothetical protein